MRVLLLTPPMIQLNTPYPATAYLTGFLRQHAARLGVEVAQADPAIELFLRIFSRRGLTRAMRCPPAPGPGETARGAARRRVGGIVPRARRGVTSTPSTPSCASCRAATPAWRCASSGAASCPRGRASPPSRRPARRRRDAIRWPGRSARSASPTAPSTWRASTSTTSPTSCATASIRASSCRATARSWPPAPPPSIRCAEALDDAHAGRRDAGRDQRQSRRAPPPGPGRA